VGCKTVRSNVLPTLKIVVKVYLFFLVLVTKKGYYRYSLSSAPPSKFSSVALAEISSATQSHYFYKPEFRVGPRNINSL
jgi:hypothetical protein